MPGMWGGNGINGVVDRELEKGPDGGGGQPK